MAVVTMKKIVFTNVSFDLDIEGTREFNLEVKNEISLKVPKDEIDKTFLLVFETTLTDPEHNYMNINVKANVIFDCDEKLSSYDDVVKNNCFVPAFKEIVNKIDQILETMNYPKLNITVPAIN